LMRLSSIRSFSFHSSGAHRDLHSFPTRRSSDLSVTLDTFVGVPTLSIAGAHVPEGNSGITILALPVTLSGSVTVPVRVSFTTIAGNAQEGVDYEKAAGVIEFAPGEQTKSIEVHILGDLVYEPDETFTVVLFNSVNAEIAVASSIVVIENDDQPAPARHRSARH